MIDNEKLKYQKRNWCKIRCRLYGAGQLSSNGAFQDIVFYRSTKKNQTLLSFSCRSTVAKEILSYNLHTPFDVWFSPSSRLYNNKYYTQNTLMYWENEATKIRDAKNQDNYTQLNNFKKDNDGK